MRMSMTDWRCIRRCRALLWLNTAHARACSSVALHAARAGAARCERADRASRSGLLAAAVCSRGLPRRARCWPGASWRPPAISSPTNPANAFFYLITGLHGLHLLGGLVALGRTTRQGSRPASHPGIGAAPQRRALRALLALPAAGLAHSRSPADAAGRDDLVELLPRIADARRIATDERRLSPIALEPESRSGLTGLRAVVAADWSARISGRSRRSPGGRP